MTRPAPSPVIARPTSRIGNDGASPHVAAPAAKSSCPAYRPGIGPERSDQTPARTIPSSCAVSMTEKARP